MTRFVRDAIAVLILAAVAGNPVHAGADRVRRSALNAQWYGTGSRLDKASLEKKVDALLENADRPELSGKLVGMVAPHAGYKYSGPAAARLSAASRQKLNGSLGRSAEV